MSKKRGKWLYYCSNLSTIEKNSGAFVTRYSRLWNKHHATARSSHSHLNDSCLYTRRETTRHEQSAGFKAFFYWISWCSKWRRRKILSLVQTKCQRKIDLHMGLAFQRDMGNRWIEDRRSYGLPRFPLKRRRQKRKRRESLSWFFGSQESRELWCLVLAISGLGIWEEKEWSLFFFLESGVRIKKWRKGDRQ